MIALNDIHKTYRTDSVQTAALRGIQLEIPAGEFTAVMGPSGCGKSTLLNLIGLLDTPSSGQLHFDGRDVAQAPEATLTELRKRRIGFVFQSFNLVEELTVEENVELALLYHGLPAAERRRRVALALERVGMGHRARHRPSQLSGGQQQRVAVGRAVVSAPGLILADEPTGNLDSVHGDEVMALLHELHQAGTTVVMVTHSAAHADHAQRVVQMRDGQIVADRRRLA
jgi:putative ABC transport system ATP-binding protein